MSSTKSGVVYLLLAIGAIVATADLESVNDDELLNLIRTEKYVVVLFTKRDCDACDDWENELFGLREDLVDSLGSWVVKAPNSQMTRLYSPSKEPVLVFFRHGVPLLYDGPMNDELILHTFTQNMEPLVKELNDETFEHLTQVATGATTGDWFVMFYTNDCVDCQRFQAQWEAVGAQLKSRLNVARVNRGSSGAATARRFDVFHVPAFVLFRQGKMYKYNIHKYDVPTFVSFARDWYKNVKAERVPLPKTPFDDLTAMIADYLRSNPWLFMVGMFTFVAGLIVSLVMKCKQSKKAKETNKSKKK
ncbi:PREDICTED: thioredoxin domain-containing protein [Nicrophorus vespilloides]|uniref:Thioredoxin domain-containing protein n=1 Tax=Nicrophorus vespilloides TaxID=110193 RepID=A0ABM1NGQ7_NICVS|nr:PREDICTED: thioredoxin domain-containing protein [Nicrophorus vespilloides]